MSPLEARQQRFSPLSSGKGQVCGVRWLHRRYFLRLRNAVIAYVSRSLPYPAVDEADLIDCLTAHRSIVQTITPGGIVVPKRNSSLEYNAVLRAFTEAVEEVVPANLIGSWHIPINVRVKFPDQTTVGRVRPSERPHSDAWAGEHPESVTVHIPVIGDSEKNYVALYEPPANFEESWLQPSPSEEHDAVCAYENELISRWGEKLAFKTPKGCALFMDASMLHASHREPGCGLRISLEAPFVWAGARQRPDILRAVEHASHEVVRSAGEKCFFFFPDAPEQRVETKGATKHPSNLIIQKLS